MYVILMGYWMVGEVRTIRIIVMFKNNLRMGDMTLGRTYMIPCKMFCRIHLISIRKIALIASSIGIVNGRGACTLTVLVLSATLSRA